LLKKLEINQEQFFDGIKNQIVKDELKKFTNDAFKKEVFGAPTFIVNNKIFWGQDRLEYAIEELN
jgi:2-hydroxychromene-2-carboxylate isomerase